MPLRIVTIFEEDRIRDRLQCSMSGGATELIEQNGGRKSVKGRDRNRMVKLDRESDFEPKFFTIIMIQVIKWSFGRKGDKLERKHSPLAMASPPFAFT